MAVTKLEEIQKLMANIERVRNIGTIAHIDHGKTTFSDNLLLGAGMISEELAGKQLVLDFDEQEQNRGITINSAAVSMMHTFEGKEYLINLIDTPGHVDFGGDVTRAMRAVDGAIVLCCAVEGTMPQTETVLRQALKERVKPILFINKVDRLINELKLPPDEIAKKLMGIIKDVNKLIQQYAPKEFKGKWIVKGEDGSAFFGSAYHNWALSVPYMQNTGFSFKDIVKLYEEDKKEELLKKAPLHKIVLNSVIRHLPNPREAQLYRIPRLWPGDADSDVGSSLLNCNQKGPMVAVITKITNDPHAGDVATARVFSGTLEKGQTVHLIGAKKEERIQQVSVYKGAQRSPVEKIPAGNIAAIVGLKYATSGETISVSPNVDSFEAITHIFEPVVTKAVEAKNMKDLPKLIDVLRQIAKEDTTLKVEINEETGEHLISGLGELHLEIWEYRIRNDHKLDIITSPPIVVYRETVTAKTPKDIEGKSPNKHNKFYITVEPLEPGVFKAISEGLVPERRVKSKDPVITAALIEAGMNKDEAKRVKDIYSHCVFIDATRGIVHLHEIIEMVIEAFHEAVDFGPLAGEKVIGMKVRLNDCKLHEDSIHRGPGQVIPAVRTAIKEAMISGGQPRIMEPVQTVRIDAPVDYMGEVSKLVQSRRGQILDMQHEGESIQIKAKLPVANMFGFTAELRSSTGGRGFWSLIDSEFEILPRELTNSVILQIRKRKGMKEEVPQIF